MIRTAMLSLALLTSCPAWAQQSGSGIGDDASMDVGPDTNGPVGTDGLDVEDPDRVRDMTRPDVATAEGALLRGLDRVSGNLTDIRISNGGIGRLGPLEVTLGECRYPIANPSGDAFAYLVIHVDGDTVSAPLFEGWMIASSPALNAMDHRRYDVWVLRCITS